MNIRTLFKAPASPQPRIVTTEVVNGALWLYEDFSDTVMGALHQDEVSGSWSYVLFKGAAVGSPKTVIDYDGGFGDQQDARRALRRAAGKHCCA